MTFVDRPRRPNIPADAPAPRLAAWVGLQVGVATAALVLVAATSQLQAGIALPWPGLPRDTALIGGLAFWLLFGLLGGVRARLRPGGAVMTFSMPFIVAGTLLGGPLAGGLMGLVSELEWREIRTQPWYGILANHAVSILAAIAAGLVGGPAGQLFELALPGQAALAFFGEAMVMALVFDAINMALLIPTLALKQNMTLREASRTPDATFRATAIGEGILAWNMAAGYLLLGWWAPIASVALVLIVWQAYDRGEALRRDPKTRLFNDVGLRPRLDAAVEAARRGNRASAFMLLDLDKFKAVNDTYLYKAGDEVLLATAQRLLMSVRATDTVARMNRAGDEFAVIFDRVVDMATARQLAERVQQRIGERIRLRTTPVDVNVTASIGVVLIEQGTTLSPAQVFELADVRMLAAKELGSGIVTGGEDDVDTVARRNSAGPRRARSGTLAAPAGVAIRRIRRPPRSKGARITRRRVESSKEV